MGRRGRGGGQMVRYEGGGGGGSQAVARTGNYNYERVYENSGTVQRGQHVNQTFRRGDSTVYQSMNSYHSVNEARGTAKHGLHGHFTTYSGHGQGSVTQGITIQETFNSNSNQVRRSTNKYETSNRGQYTVKEGSRTTQTVNQGTGAVNRYTSTYQKVKDGPNRYYSMQHNASKSGQAALDGPRSQIFLEY